MYTQYDPNPLEFKRTTKVTKMIWDESEQRFAPVVFIRIFFDSKTQLEDAIEYHKTTYGESEYQGSWWQDNTSIWLRESLATFWLLKNA